MTLRTPRRRISPRAKRRYRVIRDFFRRALGSSSQQDIKINSSIAVNVTDLKHKIVGIEHQLNEVSKHCQDFAGLESSFRRETENLLSSKSRHAVEASPPNPLEAADRRTNSSTRILYKTSNTCTRKSDESDYVSNLNYATVENRKNVTLPANVGTESYNPYFAKYKKKKSKQCQAEQECDPILVRHRTHSMLENLAAYSASSCQPAERRDQRARRRALADLVPLEEPAYITHRERITNHPESPVGYCEKKRSRSRHSRREQSRKLDQDFIADIIRKQYRPMKMFGRKHSDISQFSAPVCRDQEYSLREDILESPDLCSCCFEEEPGAGPPPHRARHDVADIRSICDTRLYSTKRVRSRPRRKHFDPYNDSDYYDLVPVKEKTSPKSRRKFAEEEACSYDYYREVPPSPRTHRPRLNLKAQYYDYEYSSAPRRHKSHHSARRRRRGDDFLSVDSEATSDISLSRRRKTKPKLLKPARVQTSTHVQRENGTTSSLPSPTYANDQVHSSLNDNSLNKSHDTDLSDKTDKALCEIKDILQTFLKEIKKEASPMSQVDKSDIPNQSGRQTSATGAEKSMAVQHPSAPSAPSAPPGFSNFNIAPCALPTGFVPPFTNPCCYSMMPMCPMNCLPSGYPLPSRSCTCHVCSTSTKDTVCQECCKQKESTEEVGGKSSETEELIKEIYKFVAQNPTSARRKCANYRNEGVKVLTSRSVGGSSRISKHDANVGTPAMKCYSKSCEAIGSRMITETSYTNATQSDTVLEKLNLEGTTHSDSDLSNGSTHDRKNKKSKFANVLRSIGLLKKKKRHVSETDSSIEVDIKPRRAPPFRQEILDYAVHAQDYYQQPPSPPYPPRTEHCHEHRHHDSRLEPCCDPRSDPRHDRRHDPRHDARHDPRHDPRLDPRHDPRHDPRLDPRRDPYGYIPPPPGCEHRGPYYSPLPPPPPPPPPAPLPHGYASHRVHGQTIHEHGSPRYPHSRNRSPAPPYSNHYDPHYGHDSHGPLCLREIEVKSTGTQSERKMSFFSKLGRKTPPQVTVRNEAPIAAAGTQTAPTLTPVQKKKSKEMPTPALFSGWKKFQEKVVADINEDPMAYGYRTHKNLAEGDRKMRNAMLKRLFYKKNPFSPNNLIIRTLLGNDPSSYGEPQVKLRSRLMI